MKKASVEAEPSRQPHQPVAMSMEVEGAAAKAEVNVEPEKAVSSEKEVGPVYTSSQTDVLGNPLGGEHTLPAVETPRGHGTRRSRRRRRSSTTSSRKSRSRRSRRRSEWKPCLPVPVADAVVGPWNASWNAAWNDSWDAAWNAYVPADATCGDVPASASWSWSTGVLVIAVSDSDDSCYDRTASRHWHSGESQWRSTR